MQKRIALFIPSLSGGGAERVAISLAKGFIAYGHQVDLILVSAKGPLLQFVPEEVRIIDLKKKRAIAGIIPLAKHLRKEKYDALISFLNNANTVAVLAKLLANFKGKVILTVHGMSFLGFLKEGGLKNIVLYFSMRLLYNKANMVVGVSSELTKELKQYLHLKNACCIHNPIDIIDAHTDYIDDEIINIKKGYDKILIGIGRLIEVKNFHLLVRSFNDIHREQSAFLIILGEGAERPRLEKLINDLGISDRVILKGFVNNPHAYLKHADLFVLSSSWEGFGLVIAEALALGKTIVSTDCYTGPAEILENGKYGYLVPVNDQNKLSQAMIYSLRNPLNPTELKRRAADFTIEKVIEKYIRAIFGK